MMFDTSARKPVVLISGGYSTSTSVNAMAELVQENGGIPYIVCEHEEYQAPLRVAFRDASKVDGIIIMGNDSDIDPACYGAKCHTDTCIETSLHRATYENTLIKEAVRQHIPLVGICGGMQRINVVGGGTLHQHVPDIVGHALHMQCIEEIYQSVQEIEIIGGSILAALAAEQLVDAKCGLTVHENSIHHQAVRDLAPGFRVSAYASDGIIEAIEPDPKGRFADQTILGIQWHPEFQASHFGERLANFIVKKAAMFARLELQPA